MGANYNGPNRWVQLDRIVKLGLKWSNLVKDGQRWSNLVQNQNKKISKCIQHNQVPLSSHYFKYFFIPLLLKHLREGFRKNCGGKCDHFPSLPPPLPPTVTPVR